MGSDKFLNDYMYELERTGVYKIADEYGKKKLDLGCGLVGEHGWIRLDKYEYKPATVDVLWDLEITPLPFEKGFFDSIRAFDILEHIHNLLPLMNDLWRILKWEGYLDIQVPRFPHPNSVIDPTHVRYFIPDTFMYFTRGYGQRFQMACRPWEVKKIDSTEDRIFVLMQPDKSFAI